MAKPHPTYGGFCSHCQEYHTLPSAPVQDYALGLIAKLESQKTILPSRTDLSTELLFNTAYGQMFGVMLARDSNGKSHFLKAFSGQFNSHYRVQNWVPPIFDVGAFHAINTPGEKEIKDLSKQYEATTNQTAKQAFKQVRRSRSRTLMKKIHQLYILKNFRGEERPMAHFFPKGKGMPTGAGDCCGPKLIQHAINETLTPIAMSEFYFGKENKSHTRQHGEFYSSCEANCAPILGFMLCGLEDRLLEK
jgi:hypothetical protein